jgi:hypothetical protein
MNRKLMLTFSAVALVAAAMFGVLGVQSVAAQDGEGSEPTTSTAPVLTYLGGLLDLYACSETDPIDVAAEALGMTAGELRAALAVNRTLDAVAQAQNVPLEDVVAALEADRAARIDQAVADGLLTEEQAQALRDMLSAAQTAARRLGISGLRVHAPEIIGGLLNRRGGVSIAAGGVLRYGLSVRNTVKPLLVAAEAMNMSCAALVQQLRDGASIGQVAVSNGTSLDTVVAALVSAYQEALDRDVAEGLIAPVQAQAEAARLTDRALNEITRAGRFRAGAALTLREGMLSQMGRMFQGWMDRSDDQSAPRMPSPGQAPRRPGR